ncbi:MAG: hypothetical protein WC708_21345, partial [Lentisphaeria bacterium]
MQTTLFSLGLTGMLVLGAGVAPVWAAAPAPVPSGVPAPATGGGWAVVAERLRAGAQETAWRHLPRQEAPTAAQLGQAVDLNRGFWLARLRKDGFFEPVTELRRRRGAEEAAAPDERCQAAALWTLAGLCRARPTPEARQALMLGLDALARQTREFPVRASAPALPGTAEIHTITVAHLALTLLEMTAGQERDLTPDGLRQMELWLQSHLAWLQAMENSEGGWAVKYVLLDQSRDTTADPATDGACFLAAVRAARWSGRADQLARLTDHGRLLARRYTGDGWREVRDPAATRAFLALGSLAYRELAQAGGPDADTFRAVAVGAAWWLALDQGAAQRERALAQTTLVLLTGAQAAREAGDPAAGAALAALAAPPLRRLAAWQVRGPLA